MKSCRRRSSAEGLKPGSLEEQVNFMFNEDLKKHNRLMHMSSACPWGRTPGQPGEYVGEYKEMNWLLCPWAGENSRHCFEFEGKGWGNSKFCKITDANHGDIGGICRFPQPINTGNIKGAKRSETENTRFRAVCKASCSQNGHLMLSMISYLNLSSGVYIPLY